MGKHGIKPDVQKGITAEMVECGEGYAEYIQEKISSPDAVVFLEQSIDMSEYVPGCFGTVDCCIIQGHKLTIIDYKYGEGVKVEAAGNSQLRLYALGAYLLFGELYEIEVIELCIFQPRMDNIAEDQMTAEELLAWGEWVKPIAQQAANGEGEYTPSEQCRWCPHGGNCRALAAICTKVARTLDGREVSIQSLADFEIAEVLALEPVLTMALKKIKSQALAVMLNGGTIPGYKVVEGKLGNRKWKGSELDACKAFEAAGYSTEDITETKLLSPAQVEKVLGKKKVAELMAGLTSREPGAPTVVRDTDKRKAYNALAQAQKDFEEE